MMGSKRFKKIKKGFFSIIGNQYNLILLIIIMIALMLRFYNIDNQSLWIDESTSLYHALKSFSSNLAWVASDNNLPLYNIILWFYIRLFGTSEFSIRLLSAVFGVLSIWLIARFGREFFSKDVGLLAALLLAISSTHIYYSQEARCYSLFILLTIASFYFFKKILHEKGMKNYVFYCIFSTMLLYTHLFSVFILIFQNLLFALAGRLYIKRWIITQLAIGFLFLPWIPFLIKQFLMVNSFFWANQPTIIELYGLTDIFGGLVFILILAFALPLSIRFTRKHRYKNAVYFRIGSMVLLLIAPVLAVYIYSQFFTPVFVKRYFLFLIPVFTLLLSYSIMLIRNRILRYVIISVLIITSIANIAVSTDNKPDWRSTSLFLKENVHPDDVIVVQPFYQIEPFSYYHNEDCFKKNVYYCVYTENIVFGFADYHGIEEQKKWLNNSIWLVQSYYQHFDPENSLFNDFNSSRSLISEKKFTGIEMYYFSKEK